MKGGQRMEHISNWIGTIVAACILVTIVQLLLPEGKNKKYVQLVCGLIITIMVVRPIVTFLNGGIRVDELMKENEKLWETTNVQFHAEEIQKSQNESIKKVYEDSLKEDIRVRLENQGYQLEEISLKMNPETFAPTELVMEVSEKSKIKPVKINTKETQVKLSQTEIDTIKKELKETYQVEVSKIKINSL